MSNDETPKKSSIPRWVWWIGGIVLVLLVFSMLVPTPHEVRQTQPTEAYKVRKSFTIAPAFYSLVVDDNPRADPESLEKIARQKCAAETICQVGVWFDESNAARRIPMLDREAQAKVFDYSVNRTTGHEKGIWSCIRWATMPKDKCFTP